MQNEDSKGDSQAEVSPARPSVQAQTSEHPVPSRGRGWERARRPPRRRASPLTHNRLAWAQGPPGHKGPCAPQAVPAPCRGQCHQAGALSSGTQTGRPVHKGFLGIRPRHSWNLAGPQVAFGRAEVRWQLPGAPCQVPAGGSSLKENHLGTHQPTALRPLGEPALRARV